MFMVRLYLFIIDYRIMLGCNFNVVLLTSPPPIFEFYVHETVGFGRATSRVARSYEGKNSKVASSHKKKSDFATSSNQR